MNKSAREFLNQHPKVKGFLLGKYNYLQVAFRHPRVLRARRIVRRAFWREETEVDRRRKSLGISGADWLGYTLGEVLRSGGAQWMGVMAGRNPLDAWVYQQIIWEIRPELVVELGALQGGTTLFLANMMDLVSMRDASYQGEVIAVDIDGEAFGVSWHPRISLVCGSTADEDVYAEVARKCVDKKTMLIHDASHTKDDVLRDLEIWSPLVSSGQYLVVEDGIVDLVSGAWVHYKAGPMAATAEFLAGHPEFELDLSREAFVFTFNQMGFLKRTDGGRG